MKPALISGALVVVSLLGCAREQQDTKVASSAESTVYALHYPEDVKAATAQLAADRAEATRLTSEIQATQLKQGASAETIAQVIDRADEAGRSEAMVFARGESTAVRGFFEDERGPLSARVSGAAQQKFADAQCQSTELDGAVSYALRDGVDKQLEKRLRARNDAYLVIEHSKASLPNGSVPSLQKLADDVAWGSYLVHIALREDKRRIERMLTERKQIQSTLERSIEEERAFRDRARNDAERKGADARLDALTTSLATLDGSTTAAEAELKDLEPQIDKARKDFEAAIDALKDQAEKAATTTTAQKS
jgi:hypothetical protein